MQTLKITITGKVQGVFMRQTIKDCADRYGIVGYAKNMPDGCSVEVLAQGQTPEMKLFISCCREGSESSKVDWVSIEETEPINQKNFDIK